MKKEKWNELAARQNEQLENDNAPVRAVVYEEVVYRITYVRTEEVEQYMELTPDEKDVYNREAAKPVKGKELITVAEAKQIAATEETKNAE